MIKEYFNDDNKKNPHGKQTKYRHAHIKGESHEA
jgi:hypothetical protein